MTHRPHHPIAAPPGEPRSSPIPAGNGSILIAMCTALIAVIASVSGLNVAQQDLAIDLGASQGQLLWVINGYTMALAALLLPIGAIGDRWGRKPILLGGLGLFMVANALAGFSTSGRACCSSPASSPASAAAMIMPVTLSVITSSFPAEERARAVGVWAGFAGAGGILGLFVSSFLDRQLHLAVAVRHAGRRSPASRCVMTLRVGRQLP